MPFESISGQHIPKVSIGMPVYNDATFVREALDSLLAQTFTDIELIIADDASTDGSAEICQEYVSRDHRVRYIRQPETKGISVNMQFLLKEARGEYFMWAADDDRWDKEFISILLDALLSNSKCVCAFCPYSFIDESSAPIKDRRARFIDYSSRTRIGRLLKLCLHYDDGCGYGLFRRKFIENVQFPTWWWINSKSLLNNIYPVLFYFLSVGDYVLAGSSPLWFNRLKEKSHHFIPYADNCFLCYWAFVLRKVNVFYESIKDVYLGSRSIVLVLMILPALSTRFVFDCIRPIVSSTPIVGPMLRELKRTLLRS